ncbi:VOC family protein [Kingella oralis]|jgi:hypothetical protein
MNYDNFFFPADDLAATKRFYQKTLGLPVKFDFSDRGMLAFQVGNEEAAIILKDKQKFPQADPRCGWKWMMCTRCISNYAPKACVF